MNDMGQFRARNYGVRMQMDRKSLGELLGRVLFLGAIAAVLALYLYYHTQVTRVGYQTQELVAKEESLLRTRGHLILEEQTLKDPERIDTIARNVLRMSPVCADQLMTPPIRDFEPEATNSVALATPPVLPSSRNQ